MANDKNMVGDVYYPTPETISAAHIPDYDEVHAAATADLAGFWGKIAAENFATPPLGTPSGARRSLLDPPSWHRWAPEVVDGQGATWQGQAPL